LIVSAAFKEKYDLKRLIGQGGMGAVYLAEERAFSRHVAVKFLVTAGQLDGQYVDRFKEEARVSASLKHAHIVSLYTADEDLGNPYLVFDYVDGFTLDQLLARQGKLSIDATLLLAQQVLSGLACAHDLGITHRDLKPGNIMIRRDTGEAMIMDFGLSKADSGRAFQTHQGMIMGTPAYISPEQIRGRPAGPQADIYSIGCTLYHCFVGAPPFSAGTETELLRLHLKGIPVSLNTLDASIPIPLDRAILRSLERDPGLRWPTVSLMLEALDDAGMTADRTQSETRVMEMSVQAPVKREDRFSRTSSARSRASHLTRVSHTAAVDGTARRSRLPRIGISVALLVLLSIGIWRFACQVQDLQAGNMVGTSQHKSDEVTLHLAVTDLSSATMMLPDREEMAISGVSAETGWTFRVPVAVHQSVSDARIIGRSFLSNRIYHLDPIKGLAFRLEDSLASYSVNELMSELIRNQGFVIDTMFTDSRASDRTMDFGGLIRRKLSEENFGLHLELFRSCGDLFFRNEEVPKDLKLRMFHLLSRFRVLDQFCLSQREPSPLQIETILQGFVRTRYALAPGADPGVDLGADSGADPRAGPDTSTRVVMISDTTCWWDQEFNSKDTMQEWHNLGGAPTVPVGQPGSRERRPPIPDDYAAVRDYQIDLSHSPQSSGTFVLSSLVCYLDAKFLYEVTFKGPSGGDLLCLQFCNPGSGEWYRAMDGVDPGTRLDRDVSGDSFLGNTTTYFAMNPHWGRIEHEFPSVLLPRGRVRVLVRYRHLPGGRLKDISYNPRLAYMGRLELRYKDKTTD